jgi:hypothetical protein
MSAAPNPHSPGQLEGDAALSLQDLPLDALPWFGDAGVSGRASGQLAVTQSGNLPVLVASLDLKATRIRDVPIGDGSLELRSNERALGATIELTHGDGTLQGTALAGLDYRGQLPRFTRGEPIGVRLTARKADAIVLAPFVQDLFTEIHGRMDADMTAAITLPKGDEDAAVEIGGQFALAQGEVELAGLGLRLHELELAARTESRGKQTRVVFEKLHARAGTRHESVNVYDGELWLEGTRIERAAGNIDAVELPLVIQGVPQAIATTRQSIAFSLTRTPTEMDVKFDIPYMLVALPQSSGRNVISLSENRSITVIQPLGEPRGQSGAGLPWRFTFELGPNVKLTRSDLDLPLTGRATVLLSDQTSVEGDIDLIPGGRIEVSGKIFIVDAGEVHFDTGDPSNPRIYLSALWHAPDGSVVNVNVLGTLKEARLTVSSPGRTQEEAYALLLGSGEGTAPGAGTGAQAAGAAVGADQLLGPLLANTPLRKVEIRTGSEQTADQRTYSTYTAGVPIGDRLWFEGSYKALNSGEPSDQASAWSGTVDFRFRRNWSLRTEVGTIGTGVDLVWNYRY